MIRGSAVASYSTSYYDVCTLLLACIGGCSSGYTDSSRSCILVDGSPTISMLQVSTIVVLVHPLGPYAYALGPYEGASYSCTCYQVVVQTVAYHIHIQLIWNSR